jgi:serine/threonine protein phosphatase 1
MREWFQRRVFPEADDASIETDKRPVTATRRDSPYPPAPPGFVFYAIGDIHGRLDCLRDAFARIDADCARQSGELVCYEIYLGDYINRGPHSAGVIDALIERMSVRNVIALKGNHEIALKNFLGGAIDVDAWKRHGGVATLMSYGVDPGRMGLGDALRVKLWERFPDSHRRFIDETRLWFTIPGYIFVHAGLRPGAAFEHQAPEDLLGIRGEFLNSDCEFEGVVVHGHTPKRAAEFKSNRINVDTGAYATGELSVLRIDAHGPALLPKRV